MSDPIIAGFTALFLTKAVEGSGGVLGKELVALSTKAFAKLSPSNKKSITSGKPDTIDINKAVLELDAEQVKIFTELALKADAEENSSFQAEWKKAKQEPQPDSSLTQNWEIVAEKISPIAQSSVKAKKTKVAP
jgi:F0F1-type ATP synthase epsilon subunit